MVIKEQTILKHHNKNKNSVFESKRYLSNPKINFLKFKLNYYTLPMKGDKQYNIKFKGKKFVKMFICNCYPLGVRNVRFGKK